MNRKLTLFIVGFGCLVSVATLYLAFRNVPLDDLRAYLKQINYWWIGPTAIMVLITFALRALRWQIILKDTGNVQYWQAFHPLMIGFMMNCILPGRVGELARPMILKKQRGIALSTGLATVVAERIFDMVALMTLLALSFSAITSQPELDKTYFGLQLNSQTLVAVAWGMIKLSVGLLIFIALISFKRSRKIVKEAIRGIARQLSFGKEGLKRRMATAADFIIKIIDNFAGGLSLVRKPKRMLTCLVLTALIWGVSAMSYLVFAKGCPGIQLSLQEFTTVMVVICFFIALPSVPGFWGLWEAAGVFSLALFGVMEKDALGYTLVNHATQLFPVIIVGLVSALMTSVNILNLSRSSKAIDKAASTIKESPV